MIDFFIENIKKEMKIFYFFWIKCIKKFKSCSIIYLFFFLLGLHQFLKKVKKIKLIKYFLSLFRIDKGNYEETQRFSEF